MVAEKAKKEKGILNKLHLIMNDVPYLQKDMKNTHFDYTYASELVIKTALHEAMIKHKVILQLETLSSRVEAASKATILSCRYKFWDVDSGENLEGLFEAAGPARDDKGLWAATTNAIKYILTSTFLIPTGDDAESDINHPKPPADNGKPEPRQSVDPNPEPKPESEPPSKEQEAKARFWFALQTKANDEKVEMLVNVKGFIEYIKSKFGTGRWDIMQLMLEECKVATLKAEFIGGEYDKE